MPPPNPPPARDRFKLRWDVLLFALLVAAAMPHATGVAAHEWLGLALVPVILVHVVLNWSWIIATTSQMFTRLPGETRFNHIWDALLYVLFIAATVSGLMVSRVIVPALGIPSMMDSFWAILHTVSATSLTMMIGVHLALHLRWVWARLKRGVATVPTPDRDKP